MTKVIVLKDGKGSRDGIVPEKFTRGQETDLHGPVLDAFIEQGVVTIDLDLGRAKIEQEDADREEAERKLREGGASKEDKAILDTKPGAGGSGLGGSDAPPATLGPDGKPILEGGGANPPADETPNGQKTDPKPGDPPK